MLKIISIFFLNPSRVRRSLDRLGEMSFMAKEGEDLSECGGLIEDLRMHHHRYHCHHYCMYIVFSLGPSKANCKAGNTAKG